MITERAKYASVQPSPLHPYKNMTTVIICSIILLGSLPCEMVEGR